MPSWEDISIISIPSDLIVYEPYLASGITEEMVSVETIKAKLSEDLGNRLSYLEKRGQSVYGSDFVLLDHIKVPMVLKRPAVMLCLSYCLGSLSVSRDDEFKRKAALYKEEYPKSLENAISRLTWDVDLSEPYLGSVTLVR